MKVKKSLLKFISPHTDREARLKTARNEGREFMALPPSDRLTVLFIISHTDDDELSTAALVSLDGVAETLILTALEQTLDVLVLRYLYLRFKESTPVLSAIASNAGIDGELAFTIAKNGPGEAINAFESNPCLSGIISSVSRGLKENPLVDKAVAEKLEAASRKQQEKDETADAEPGHAGDTLKDLISKEEEFNSDRFNVFQALCNMTAGEKIKLAHTGDRSVRNLLIKDKNRVVATSVLKNPKLTEQEVVMTISSTSVSEEIIREIANTRQWMKSYKIKTAMVLNPHTPLSFSLKIVDYLRDKELKELSKNKGVPGALVHAAIRKLKLKKR